MVVVGAGVAGARAAFALREHGWSGPVQLIGQEELLPYDRPPLSKSAMTDEVVPGPAFVSDSAAFRAAGIETFTGTPATHIDTANHDVVVADGRVIRYERLLLAVGAKARRLNIAGAQIALTLRTHADAVAIRETLKDKARVGVIGGGLIGLELAASATARGCSVTVIELESSVMARAVPAAIATIVAARHAKAGVTILTGVRVERVVLRDGAFGLALSTGENLDVDVVIAAVGVIPDTDLARSAGIAVDNGIVADARLRTSSPDVYACGDCCSIPHVLYEGRRIRSEAWRSATDQGSHAARNMAGAEEDYSVVPWFWSDQHDIGVQVAGLHDAAVNVAIRGDSKGAEVHFGLDASGRLVSASGVGSGNSVAKDIRVAELLIGQRATPRVTDLADPTINLKTMLWRPGGGRERS
jgi:3-phenylpropionate/trans-cinnamate dioxygenase ferredoxin reductase component